MSTLARLTNPTPGSILGASTEFKWDAGVNVQGYWLGVRFGGEAPGVRSIYSLDMGTTLSTTLSIPQVNRPIYVRLWSLINGSWYKPDGTGWYRDYVFMAGYVYPWTKCTEIYFRNDNPTGDGYPPDGEHSYLPAILNGVPAQTDALYPPNTWLTFDCKPLGVASDAKAVLVHSLLVITHGAATEVAYATCAFRRPGYVIDNSGNYHTIVVEASREGGQRTNDAIWVPVQDGKFEFQWRRMPTTQGFWPEFSSHGINMIINAWAR